MKNFMNKRYSETQPRNDFVLNFSDPSYAGEMARLLRPAETLQKDSCTKWQSIFDAPASKTKPDS
ncbi:MAG: hypothetical protein WCK63_18750 [Betaproteobacteria bacterium]